MHYELGDYVWANIRPMLPSLPRGVPRVNERRILNGAFWVFRSGAPWRDLPARYGDWKIVYQRFNRWSKSGVFDHIFKLLASDPDNEYMMVDATIVRAHQHSAGARKKTARKPSAGRVAD